MRTSTFLIGLAFFVVNLSIPEADARQEYSEEDCHLSGISGRQRCFTMTRPSGEGETIEVGGVILSSDAVTPLPDPLVILTGGPGQAASDAVTLLRGVFRPVLRERDLIFLDIRGTGRSNPVSCRDYFETYPPLTYVAPEEAYGPLGECYAKEGTILADANTRTAAADLEALRQHLAIEQMNIWGVSYGTRLAQYYAANNPAHVRSLVLDGVVPFSPAYIDVTRDSAADAVQRLLDDCLADAACAASFPGFDLYGLLDRIEGVREISYRHPVTGGKITTHTNRETVAQVLFGALYTPATRASIPFALTEAIEQDNWGPLAVLADDANWYFGIENIYAGARLSVLCAEEDLSGDGAVDDSGLFKDWGGLKQMFSETCARWPVESIRLPSPEAGSFLMPTVMISGGFDPITPPRLARHAESYYSTFRHIILENGGHFNSHVPCVAKYINVFIEDPTHLNEETDCIGDGHFPDFVTLPDLPFSGQEEVAQ